MSRTKTISRQLIVEGTLNLAKREGLRAISAKSVAEEMSASTIIIYSNFNNLDELRDLTVISAFNLLDQYLQKSYTERELFDIGVGFIMFASNYPNLFNDLFMYKNHYSKILAKRTAAIIKKMPEIKPYDALTTTQLSELVEKVQFVCFGMAAMISMGRTKKKKKNDIIAVLDEMTKPIINAYVGVETKKRKK